MNAIEAMQSAQSRILQIRSWKSGPGTVHVSVEDSGVGIDPSNADRVFEHLFTTKSQGMGMGLAICRSIIENHGGRIWVSAAAGRGAVFQFELPAAESRMTSQDLAA
jgi:signal transduction histidine kinase